MSIETKQTLKSYFESGDTPTEAQFATLIDSLLGIQEEVVDNLVTDSSQKALAAKQGVALKALVDALGIRVGSIEELNETTLKDYLKKAELGSYLEGKAEIGHTHLASNITDLLDVVYSKSQVNDLIDDYVVKNHKHEIGDVNGLQTALDNANDASLVASTKAELETKIDAKASSGHQHTESDISDLKNYLESATATVLLQSKAEVTHTHTESQITDLDKYTKKQVDDLFAGVVRDGSVPAHTHTEANISDLDKYSKSEVDQKVSDAKTTMLTAHLNEDNPHGITKTTVSLGNVDNLSRVSLFNNPTFTGNVMGVTKAHVSLGNVPDVNVLDLLNTHLADTANPHEVELGDFDAYSTSETDGRIQEMLEIFRQVHVGTLPQDGTGSTGLVTQKDIWDRVKDINFDPSSNKTIIDGNLESTGDLEVGGEVKSNTGDLVISGVSLGSFKVKIDDQLAITGETTIGGSGSGEDADLTVHGTIRPKQNIKSLTGDLILEGEDGSDVKVNDNLFVQGSINPNNTVKAQTGDLILEGKDGHDVQVNDTLKANKNAEIGTATANAELIVNGNTTVTGNLTVQGVTTSIDTTNLVIEDNIILLNKNQSGTPANTLKSGIEVERGSSSNTKLYFDEASGRWKAQIVSGSTVVTKTIAFVEDAYSQG
jgi:hypothetical protein